MNIPLGNKPLGRRALLAAPLLAAPFVAAAGKLPPAAMPISRINLPWWRARHEAKLAELKRGPVELIWLGDSITENWEKSGPEPWEQFHPVWERLYGRYHPVNLGFKGDATCHLLWRIMNGELQGISPKAAVILIGANNLGRLHWSAPDSILGIETVVAETRRRLPRTKLLLLGVLPCGRGEWVDTTTREINQSLASRFGGGSVPDVTYRDVGGLFLRNGALDVSQFYDPKLTPPDPPLHPTAQAQERLAQAIAPVLNQLLA